MEFFELNTSIFDKPSFMDELRPWSESIWLTTEAIEFTVNKCRENSIHIEQAKTFLEIIERITRRSVQVPDHLWLYYLFITASCGDTAQMLTDLLTINIPFTVTSKDYLINLFVDAFLESNNKWFEHKRTDDGDYNKIIGFAQ